MAITEDDIAMTTINKDTQLTQEEIAELRKKAHAFDSEQGRLKKAQEELEQANLRAKELEEQLQAASKSNPPAFITEANEVFGDDGARVMGAMFGDFNTKLDKITEALQKAQEKENVEAARAAYFTSLEKKLADSNLAGLSTRLYNGDLREAWNEFTEARVSLRRAQESGDVEAVSDFITTFIQTNRDLVLGGGHMPNPSYGEFTRVKPDYSDNDYMRDSAALESQLKNLVISEEDYKRKMDENFAKYCTSQEKAELASKTYGLV